MQTLPKDETPSPRQPTITTVDALVIIALLALSAGAAVVLVAIVLVAVNPHPWTAVVSAMLAAVL